MRQDAGRRSREMQKQLLAIAEGLFDQHDAEKSGFLSTLFQILLFLFRKVPTLAKCSKFKLSYRIEFFSYENAAHAGSLKGFVRNF